MNCSLRQNTNFNVAGDGRLNDNHIVDTVTIDATSNRPVAVGNAGVGDINDDSGNLSSAGNSVTVTDTSGA